MEIDISTGHLARRPKVTREREYTYKTTLRVIRRLWGVGGPAGRPTVYHNNITPVSRQHHIFRAFKQHLNISLTTVSHRYHIGVASISNQLHINITTISQHTKTTSQQFTSISQQYNINATPSLHHYQNDITSHGK